MNNAQRFNAPKLAALLLVAVLLFAVPAMIFAQEDEGSDDSSTQPDSSYNRGYDVPVTITCDTVVYFVPDSGAINNLTLAPGQNFNALPYLFVMPAGQETQVNTDGWVELSIASASAPLYVPVECVSGFTSAGTITWQVNRSESFNLARSGQAQDNRSVPSLQQVVGREGWVEVSITSEIAPVYVPVECVSGFTNAGTIPWLINRSESFNSARNLAANSPAQSNLSGLDTANPFNRGYDQMVTITCNTPVYFAPGSGAIAGEGVTVGQTWFALPYLFIAPEIEDDAALSAAPVATSAPAETTESADADATEESTDDDSSDATATATPDSTEEADG